MSDALDRLKQRKRPKVQPRSTQVSQPTVDISTHRHIDVESPETTGSQPFPPDLSEDIQIYRHIDPKASQSSEVADSQPVLPKRSEDIQMSRHTDLKTSQSLPSVDAEIREELEVKRSTFRLEVGLISRLHRLCQDNGLSREVMIESMFEYMESNSEALTQVLQVADAKNIRRQQIANRKRAESMIKKFGQ